MPVCCVLSLLWGWCVVGGCVGGVGGALLGSGASHGVSCCCCPCGVVVVGGGCGGLVCSCCWLASFVGGWLVVGVVVFCWIVDASIFVACCCLLCASVCAALWWCGWGCVVGVASVQGRMVDALASRADEGRWSLRKALGSWQPSCDPGMSEWGNLAGVMSSHLYLNS